MKLTNLWRGRKIYAFGEVFKPYIREISSVYQGFEKGFGYFNDTSVHAAVFEMSIAKKP